MAYDLGVHLCLIPSAGYNDWNETGMLKAALGYLNYARQFAVDPKFIEMQIEPALKNCTEKIDALRLRGEASSSLS